MDERKITVGASYSRKVQTAPYEMADIFFSESRELPANADQGVVDAMRAHLFKSCEEAVEERVARIKPQK